MLNNSSLKPVEQHILNGHIDWTFIQQWMRYNPTNSPTSESLYKKQGSRIKKSNFIHPTLDILQRNYPKLYSTNMLLCKECETHTATNSHLGICPKHINFNELTQISAILHLGLVSLSTLDRE